MTWYEQSKSMMEMWANTQKQMLEGWSNMAGTTTSTVPKGMPGLEMFSSMMDWWRETMTQNTRAWLAAADPTAQDVAEKMFSSQSSMIKLLQMSMKVWENIVPVMQEGGNWRAALERQMETVRNELLQSATESANAGKNMMQLWQSYLEQFGGFSAPWSKAMQGSMGMMGRMAGGDNNALVEMTNLYWDAFQESFGKLLTAPGLGYTREMDEKVRHAFAAWLDFQQASYEYQVILADTWVHAFEALLKDAAQKAQRGETIRSLREFLNYWSTTADNVFKDAFRSERYIMGQGKLVSRMMTYRTKQRDVNEMAMNIMDVPTRSEVDEAHRRIYELRKEIKALKQEMAELRREPGSSAEAPKKPARKSSAKTKAGEG